MKKIFSSIFILMASIISLSSCHKDDDSKSSKTFVLVAGAWQGAYAWQYVKPQLEKAGQKVIVVELPAHGDDNTPPYAVSMDVYRDKVIAAVNGFALGGGCEMAMSCDFIYATDNAVFGQPEVKLGLIPGFGGTQRLAKLVGRNNAKELIYSGRNVKADEALRMGLIVRTFPSKEAMMTEALKTLKTISSNSPFAVSIAKKVMNEGIDLTIAEGLQLEKRQFSGIFSSEDMREGTRAFVEKRAPSFKGK